MDYELFKAELLNAMLAECPKTIEVSLFQHNDEDYLNITTLDDNGNKLAENVRPMSELYNTYMESLSKGGTEDVEDIAQALLTPMGDINGFFTAVLDLIENIIQSEEQYSETVYFSTPEVLTFDDEYLKSECYFYLDSGNIDTEDDAIRFDFFGYNVYLYIYADTSNRYLLSEKNINNSNYTLEQYMYFATENLYNAYSTSISGEKFFYNLFEQKIWAKRRKMFDDFNVRVLMCEGIEFSSAYVLLQDIVAKEEKYFDGDIYICIVTEFDIVLTDDVEMFIEFMDDTGYEDKNVWYIDTIFKWDKYTRKITRA